MLLFNWHLTVLVALVLTAQTLRTTNAAVGDINIGLVTFPAQACSCSNMACSCCQSVAVNMVNLSKSLCLQFKVSIVKMAIDVNIQLDGKTIGEFALSAKASPSYCIPVVTESLLAMCVAFHDIGLVGLSGLKACTKIYASFVSNQIFSINLPCVKFTATGMALLE